MHQHKPIINNKYLFYTSNQMNNNTYYRFRLRKQLNKYRKTYTYTLFFLFFLLIYLKYFSLNKT